jgi:hypothetical protein
MKTENNHPGTLGNILTLFSAGFSQLFFVVSIIFLILTIDIYSGSGNWALITYVVFLPALVLFIVLGAIASAKKQTFKAVYFYENLALMAASIIGILYLALALQDATGSLMRPGPLESESVMMLLIGLVVPTGLGFALAWFLYRRAGPQPGVTSPFHTLSPFGLFILWILTNVFASLAWSLLASSIDPDANEIPFAAWSLGASMAAGITAGLLQFVILIFVLRTANRWLLAAWVPITVLGWALITLIYIILPSAGILGTVAVMGSQIIIGLLQWLLLRKHGQVAFLWIPALLLDQLLVSLSFSAYALGDLVGGLISGVAGSIISSVVIVYILRKYLTVTSEDTKSLSKTGSNTPGLTTKDDLL